MDRQYLSSAFSDIEDKYGLPSGYLDQTAEIESNHNPRSFNELSKAKGMFQFIPGTAREYGLKNPYDPIASADAAARYAVKNQSALRDALGRDPSAGELYLAHQQGTDGAVRLLNNPNTPAGRLVNPRNISANGGNPNAPASQFANKWTSRYTDVDSMHGKLMAFAGKDETPGGEDVWDKQFGGESPTVDKILQRYNKTDAQATGKDEKAESADIDRLLSRYGPPKSTEVEAKPVKTTKEAPKSGTKAAPSEAKASADPVKDWVGRMAEEHPNIKAGANTGLKALLALGRGALEIKRGSRWKRSSIPSRRGGSRRRHGCCPK